MDRPNEPVLVLEADISPTEEIIEEARQGRMFILVDAVDRENEGDLIIPATFADAKQINFMATHGRGLICLAMTRERAQVLDLDLMARTNRENLKTAFTVSIEAREGVTTGISAHDRARTVAVAVDPTCDANDIVSPGHVFPLIARDGGTLVRAGHTEAAVDIARMAGLMPAGVICEIMNDDGSMARLPDLAVFARHHNLKIGTISDLIAWRRKHDRYVERIGEMPINTAFGEGFRAVLFRSRLDGQEHIAIQKGCIRNEAVTTVRVHRVDILSDLLGEKGARRDIIPRTMALMNECRTPCAIVFVNTIRPGSMASRFGIKSSNTPPTRLREYGIGAQILRDLGVTRMRVISETERPERISGLEGYGLSIIDWHRLSG
tara:strand:- start:7250 stop:8383 length:1134 start_codon:yes stop_codon:yes gene_type:complete